MKVTVWYGLGGGFGGAINEEEIEVDNLEEAETYAHQAACEDYDQYDGLHGLRNEEGILEELQDNNSDDEDDESLQALAAEMYIEEREGWLEWKVEKI